LRTKNTKENLLLTSINLFYKKGYNDTTIRDIGAKAGISNSIIYHYFKNKEEMLFEITYKASQDLTKSLQEIKERVSDPIECLREMLKAHTFHFSLRKEAKMLAIDLYWLEGKHKKIIRDQQIQIYNIYMENLKKLSEKRLLNDINLTVINFNIFGIINSFFRWYREGGRLSKEEVTEYIIRFIFHAVLNQEALSFHKLDYSTENYSIEKEV